MKFSTTFAARSLTLAGLVVVLAMAAWLAYSRMLLEESVPDEGLLSRSGPPAPENLNDLMAESEIVVRGRVVEFLSMDQVYPDDYDPEAEPPREGVDIGVPFSNYRVVVSEYIVGSGPDEIVLRQLGDATGTRPAFSEFPHVDEGSEVVLFLAPVKREVPGLTDVYRAPAGPWGQFVEQSGRLEHADGAPVTLSDAETLAELAERARRLAPSH